MTWIVRVVLVVLYITSAHAADANTSWDSAVARVEEDRSAIQSFHEFASDPAVASTSIFRRAGELEIRLSESQRLQASRPPFDDRESELQFAAMLNDLNRYLMALDLYVSDFYQSFTSLEIARNNMNQAWLDFQRDYQSFLQRRAALLNNTSSDIGGIFSWGVLVSGSVLIGGFAWRRRLVHRAGRLLAAGNQLAALQEGSTFLRVESVYDAAKAPFVVSWIGVIATADGDAGWLATIVLMLLVACCLPFARRILAWMGVGNGPQRPMPVRTPTATVTVRDRPRDANRHSSLDSSDWT